MKFRKFGKALLMSAVSVGAVLCVTSCVQSYTVGFLYVTGNVTAGTTGQGIISGFKIDHNTGYLTPINGMPIASGGANPGRAVSAGRLAILLRAEPGRGCFRRGRLHLGHQPVHGIGHHPVCGRRQWRPVGPAAAVLHPGPQPVPHRRRLAGELHLRARSRRPGQRRGHLELLHAGAGPHIYHLRRHYRLPGESDHRDGSAW